MAQTSSDRRANGPSQVSGKGGTENSSLLLALILCSGLFLRLLMAWTDVAILVQKTLPDDAFYYFTIARNILAGRGVTVDGLHPTNGFHPLWAVWLLLPSALFPGQAIPAGLSLAALADVGTAWLCYRAVQAAGGRARAALVAASFYAFNPLAAMEAANGLETALSTFFLAWFFYYYLTAIRGREAKAGRYAFFSALAGMAFLARTDSIFMLALIEAGVLCQARREKGTLPLLAISGLAFLLIISPWLAWNWLTFGTFVQSSGIALPFLIKYSMAESFHNLPLAEALSRHVGPALYLSFLLFWYYSGVGWTALIVAAFALRFFRDKLPLGTGRGLLSTLKPFTLPLLAAFLIVLFHTFYRWYPRSWYYVPLAWASALCVGPGLAYVEEALRKLSRRGEAIFPGLLALAVLLFALLGLKWWKQGFYPWQIHMYRASQWLAENVKPGQTTGAFNAGMQAYFSPGHVVNLDGVTDWEALKALRERRLLDYARARSVIYIVDFRQYIHDSYAPFWGEGYPYALKLVETLSPPYPPYGPVAVYGLEDGG